MISLTKDKRMLGYELFSAYPNISCFVTTRTGGCSEGAYASFNCSPFCGDKEAHVLENQKFLCRALPQHPLQLIIPKQVHDTKICVVDPEFLSLSPALQQEKLNGVDAVVTTEPGYCVCVSTADCVPLLIYDRKHHVVAAVHAGWRGTVNEIAWKTLNLMREQFGTSGEDTLVSIGPSISLASFEVGEEVYEAFREKGYDMSRIAVWKEEKQKHHLDLWEANRIQLRSFGIPDAQMACADICTFIHHERFFSARRLGIQSGRILSGVIMSKNIDNLD